MDTPICDFVSNYIKQDPLRLHMPGHKGISLLGCEAGDITEIGGADVLYQPKGIIRESERNAENLFGTARTVYSAEGSSLPIRAMLYLLRLHLGRGPRILAARNAHKVFVSAAALLDAEVTWLYPGDASTVVSCRVDPADLERALDAGSFDAVYVTSPDYLGNIAPIRAFGKICHKRGVLLLVDNAHGAYLRFLPRSLHPMDLGADLCCDSAHKTLPVLTGGAYLHVSKTAPRDFAENADRAMAMFASTSPSYLIMQSLDRANRYLSEDFREPLAKSVQLWAGVRENLQRSGWQFTGDEPMKLTILPKSFGYTGTELAEILEKQNIFVEFADPDYTVMMLSSQWEEGAARRLEEALLSIPRRTPIADTMPRFPHPEQAIPARDAIFLPCEKAAVTESAGRIMASPTVSCPPAIPIVSCGERISREAVSAMQYYGIETVSVVV